MPIALNLTKREDSIISLIKNLKGFSKAKKEYKMNLKISDSFKKNLNTLHELNNNDRIFDLVLFAFDDPVDRPYVEGETELIEGKEKIRPLERSVFEKFVQNCADNDSQYLYFRFTNSANHFNLGYVDSSCKDPQKPCSFIGSNIDDKEDEEVKNDPKGKSGSLHKKSELLNFFKDGDTHAYLHKRQYKKDKETGKKTKHTVIISNQEAISDFARLENKGGSCCPPEI